MHFKKLLQLFYFFTYFYLFIWLLFFFFFPVYVFFYGTPMTPYTVHWDLIVHN